jgi:hypothetical protein
LFDPTDDVTSVYHFTGHVVEFYTGEKVRVGRDAMPVAARDETSLVRPTGVGFLADGDVMILNREPVDYDTQTLPPELKPLLVQRVRLLELQAANRGAGGARFVSSETPQVSAELIAAGGGHRIEGRGLPAGRYVVYADLGRPEPRFLAEVSSDSGRFAANVARRALGERTKVRRLLIYRFEPLEEFRLPGRETARRDGA